MIDWTESKMQDALVSRGNLFDYTRYAVVPNVSYALPIRGEVDLLCLSKTGTFHEVEIKVSKSDLRADSKKWHAHQNAIVSYTWFAVPEELETAALEVLPDRFGLVVVEPIPNPRGLLYLNEKHQTRVARKAKKWTQQGSRKPTNDEIIKFLRTGVIRMWTRRTDAA